VETTAAFCKIPIGISACLLGDKVRFDGQHKHDPFLTGTLGPYFDYVPICPEVGCGLPVPREAMHLVGTPDSPRLVGVRSGTDFTAQMLAYCERTVEALKGKNLHGFIFKARSPSSGLFRVKLYTEDGNATNLAAVYPSISVTHWTSWGFEMAAMPEVEEVSAVSGQFDYLAFLRCVSHERLDSLLDQIGQMDGVHKTQTSIVLSRKIDRRSV